MNEPGSTAGGDVEEVVQAVLDMMASGRPDALRLLTEDVDLRSPLGDIGGRDQLRSALNDWHDGMSDARAVVENVRMSGGTAVASWHLVATHTGVILVNEDRLFEPAGAQIDLAITTELDFDGSLVSAVRHEFLLDDLLAQIGVR